MGKLRVRVLVVSSFMFFLCVKDVAEGCGGESEGVDECLGAYRAAVADNVSVRGTSAGAQQEAISTFNNAAQKCPESYLVASGYS